MGRGVPGGPAVIAATEVRAWDVKVGDWVEDGLEVVIVQHSFVSARPVTLCDRCLGECTGVTVTLEPGTVSKSYSPAQVVRVLRP